MLNHSVSKLDKICTNTQTLANAGTHTCSRLHQTHTSAPEHTLPAPQRELPPPVASRSAARAICLSKLGHHIHSLTVIPLTHRTKRTKHALNARHRAAACSASIMRGSPRITPNFPCTARAPAVWMGRTCKRSRDGALCCQCACKQYQG